MFYVSKVVGRRKYAIMDTEDGIEQVLDVNEIIEALETGIDIEGINYKRFGTGRVSINYIIPISETKNVKALKALMLQGVSMEISGDTLVSIYLDSATVDSNLVLSKYCSNVADYVVRYKWGEHIQHTNHKVTIILDDKVTFSAKSFKDADSCRNAIFDIRQMTNETLINNLYKSCFSTDYRDPHLHNIIDNNQSRLNFYILERFFNKSYYFTPHDITKNYTDAFADEKARQMLTKYYKREFINLSKNPYTWQHGSTGKQGFIQNVMSRGVSFSSKDIGNAEILLRHSNYYYLLFYLGRATTSNSNKLERFFKYMMLYNYLGLNYIDLDIKNAYLYLCRRIADNIADNSAQANKGF